MNIKKMIDYRGVWMGLAMLWIMLFHSKMAFAIPALSFFKRIGYGGVDIFLFASGVGNYYSYLKDENPLDFLKRRIVRLAPVYVPFIFVWSARKAMVGEMKPIYVLGNVLGVQALSSAGKSFNWYLAALAICYVLTPYFATYVKKNNMWKCILLLAGLLLISTAFWNDDKFIVSVSRLPIYVIGMMFAKYDSQKIKKRYIFVILAKSKLSGAFMGIWIGLVSIYNYCTI